MRNDSDKNVLLLHAPAGKYAFGRKWIKNNILSPPLGLLYLGSPLLREGYNVSYVDLNVDHFKKAEFMDLLKESNFILITCFNYTIHNVEKIIKDIKRVNEKAFILCGGHYFNTFKEYVEGSYLTCIGEAEGYITKILDSIILKKSLNGIPGLIYKKDGQVVENPGIMKVDDLDSSLPPAWELINRKKYGFIGNARVDVAMIMSSRGCPYNCHYCAFTGDKRYRTRSVNNVVNEIKSLIRQGYKYISFCDDNFLANKRRVHKIMDKIIQEKIKVKILVQARVDSADYELYKKLRDAGTILMAFGLESGNQDVLDYYNKRTTVEKAVEAINLANKVGLVTFGHFMIGAPFETEKHFNKNKEFIDSIPLDLMTCYILWYQKGSKLWEEAIKKGIIKASELSVLADRRLSNYSSKELAKIKYDFLYHFYMNPRRWLKLLYKVIRLGEARLIVKAVLNTKLIFNLLGFSD
ncbi:MAG: B12-binding domain-containing radical SAM protein [Candidatus Hermodarchaeota archaeon]